jgi:uncharacterized protein
MPEYLSPGVYVEEVDAGPKPIEGVSTSTAGAVGVTARGPSKGKPQLVTSFADFVRTFGGAVSVPVNVQKAWEADPERGEFWSFPLSVKGFFDNGGQRLYVRRVVSKDATAANGTLGAGVIAVLDADADTTSKVLKLQHLIGLDVSKQLELWVEGVKSVHDIDAYDAAARTVTLKADVGKKLRAGRDYAVLVGNSAGFPATAAIKLTAKAAGGWANDVRVRVAPSESATLNLLALTAEKEVRTKIAADVASDKKFKIEAAAFADIAVDDVILVGGAPFKVKLKTAPDELEVDIAAPRKWDKDTAVTRVRFAKATGASSTLFVWGAGSLYPKAIVELDNGKAKHLNVVDKVEGSKVTLKNAIPASYLLWERDKLRLIEAEVRATYPGDGGEGAIDETIGFLRLSDDPADPNPSYIKQRLTAGSALIEI